MTDAFPFTETGVNVGPHCVQLALGIPPGMPAMLQSIARGALMMPDHGVAARAKEPDRATRSDPAESGKTRNE